MNVDVLLIIDKKSQGVLQVIILGKRILADKKVWESLRIMGNWTRAKTYLKFASL